MGGSTKEVDEHRELAGKRVKRAKRVGGEIVDTHKHPFGSDSPKRSCSNKIKQPRLVHAVETE